jgi:hypothetical protein
MERAYFSAGLGKFLGMRDEKELGKTLAQLNSVASASRQKCRRKPRGYRHDLIGF